MTPATGCGALRHWRKMDATHDIRDPSRVEVAQLAARHRTAGRRRSRQETVSVLAILGMI